MNTSDVNKMVAGYETNWYLADFWPGEYPPRFSVTQDGVVLAGRAEMRLTAEKNVNCPVPKFATYSPWNHTRNEADNLQYRTVTKIATITITDNVTLSATTQLDQVDVNLDLQAGDTLQFLIYHGEGFALYRYQDSNYILNAGDLEDKAQFEETEREDDLWLEMPAENGERGWVLFSDAIATGGIVESEIEGFGIANDLTDPESLTLEGVGFVSGGADLTDTSKQILDALADKLRQVSGVIFEISGHTDSVGSSESNQKLSYTRAVAVADYLVDQAGVNFEIFRVKGYGEDQPIADNGTAEGRAANRRVELRILDL